MDDENNSQKAEPYCEKDNTEENIKTFVGKNSDKILPKFLGMELGTSRVSWCWPAAILSLFFGFFGTAIWFFYRKLYKPALICVAIGTLFCAANMIITYDATVSLLSQSFDAFKEILLNPENSILELQSILEGFETMSQGINVEGILSDIETTLSVVLGGLFALGIYRNHVNNKIEKISMDYSQDVTFKARLKYSGGVSGGMAFLGVVIMLAITAVIEAIPVIMFFALI